MGEVAEGDNFPIVCEACLGPNPYTRMIKSDMSAECRISGIPFTAFRWQGALRRWKSTIVCSAVAREKNCCQACLSDLEYAVPFHVRDHVMDALGEEKAPQSDISKEFHWANKKQKISDGEAGGYDTYEKLHSHMDKLRQLAALEPGPVVWQKRRETPLTPEEQERLRARRQTERRPPADTSITSLFVGGVPPSIGKKELLPYFMAYGDVSELTLDAQRLAAIVTFRERAAAEAACAALYGNFTVRSAKCRVSWARKSGRSEATSSAAPTQAHDHYGDGARKPPPPPPPPKATLPPGVRPPPGIRDTGTRPDVG